MLEYVESFLANPEYLLDETEVMYFKNILVIQVEIVPQNPHQQETISDQETNYKPNQAPLIGSYINL